jgi:DNA-binding transcriptional MerR regulator
MSTDLSIGDFSQVTHLSIKTLRHYHDAGLLEPARIDPSSGYRYYNFDQVPVAQVIKHFRELGMPVPEVREVVLTQDPNERNELIAKHLERLEKQLAETRAAVTSLRRLLQPHGNEINVEHRSVKEVNAAAISETIDIGGALPWFNGALAELDFALSRSKLRPLGPKGGLFENALFTDEHGEALVYVPVEDAPKAGRVRPMVVPAAELAVVVHRGPIDDIDVTYSQLGSYVKENALAVAGPVRETYVIGAGETDEESQWITEIGWPVFRTSASG